MRFAIYHQPDGEGDGAEDYLSRLANSILNKEQRPPTVEVPPGGFSKNQLGQGRQSPSNSTHLTPLPIGGPGNNSQRTPLPTGGLPRQQSFTTPAPESGSGTATARMPAPGAAPTRPQSRDGRPPSGEQPLGGTNRGEWVRRVDYYDESGNLLPGVILVFEDGSMGVFKERNPRKDYDIVYILNSNTKAVPQGMPLYNYSVEPVGRLSANGLDTLVQGNRWERDMIVFHLLKYKDRVHIPQINEHADDAEPIANSEHLSQMSVQKLSPEMLRPDYKPEEAEKPALTRGREMTIEFGPSQKWKAIYWGKDELGHVVAHNTHDHWSLMHLDLNRFKDSITFGNIVSADVIRVMERDFHTL